MFTKLSILLLSLLGAVRLPACAPSRRFVQQEAACVVGHVVDGDTFRCGDGTRVRLIGIDTPERRQGPFGIRAQQALVGLLPQGTAVRLEQDVAASDQYRRRLAYAWAGSTLVNEAMLRGGWAVLYTVPPNVKYAERFERAQNEARARRAGLWAQDGFACLPKDFRRRTCLSPP